MPYGDSTGTPAIGDTILYFLTQEEYNRYGVQSVQATVLWIHTAVCIDLTISFTTKGANPGQTVAKTELNVSYGQNQGNWCEAGGCQGVIPGGSPF